MGKNRGTRSGRDSSANYKVRGERWVSARPIAMKMPPGASDYFVEKPDIRNPHKDYNLVSMSDFKVNPSLYMVWSKHIPLAVTRYGRIQSMIMSLAYFNQLLLKIRDLQAEIKRLEKMLKTIDPTLLKIAQTMKIEYELNPDRATWPLLDQQPKRRRVDEIKNQTLHDAVDELKAYSNLFSSPDDQNTDTEFVDGW